MLSTDPKIANKQNNFTLKDCEDYYRTCCSEAEHRQGVIAMSAIDDIDRLYGFGKDTFFQRDVND